MGWRSAARLSAVVYREVGFQAIHAFRMGNTLPAPKPGEDLSRQAMRRVTQSKLLLNLLLVGLNLGVFAAIRLGPFRFVPGILPGLFDMSLVAALLLLELSLLWMTGVQILPTLIRSRVFEAVAILPLPNKEVDRTALLVLGRLFDIPALTAIVLTPLTIGWAMNSPFAGLTVLPGVVAVVVFAIGLALATGRFFVRRVEGARGGWRSMAFRWTLLILWALPAFAIYVFVSFSPELLRALSALGNDPTAGTSSLLFSLAFPFPYAFLTALAGGSIGSVGRASLPWLLGAAAAYVDLAGLMALRILTAPRRLIEPALVLGAGLGGVPARLGRMRPGNAVLFKDIRTASRTPGYAFLVILPLLDALVLALSSYVGTPRPSSVFSLAAAAISTAALLAIFFGPAFFATEVMGFSYTRTLPLSRNSLLWGKASLVLLIYALATALVAGATLAHIFAPLLFLAFAVAELPGLAAAVFLELGIIARRAERQGIPLTNLYTGAWWATAVAIPGLIVAGLPLFVFALLGGIGGHSGWALPAMALAAIGELAIFAPFALAFPGRRAL